MEVTDATFQKEVLESTKLVMVDFWAPWCMPCQMLTPVIETLAEELKDTVDVKKINVDENQETANKYNIRSIPAVFFFKNGEVVKEVTGMQSRETYKQVIDELTKE